MVYWSLLVNFWLLPVPALHGSETQYLSGSVPGSVCPVFKGIKYIHSFWLNIYLLFIYVIRFIIIYLFWCQFHTQATCHAASCCLQICLQSLDPPACTTCSKPFALSSGSATMRIRQASAGHTPKHAKTVATAPDKSTRRTRSSCTAAPLKFGKDLEQIGTVGIVLKCFETKFWTQQHGYWLGIGW